MITESALIVLVSLGLAMSIGAITLLVVLAIIDYRKEELW